MDKWARRVGLTPAGRGRWPVPEERRLEILSRYRRDSFSDES